MSTPNRTSLDGEISNFLSDNSSRFSPATIKAYAADLRDFAAFALEENVNSWPQVEPALIGSFTSSLKNNGYSEATIARKVTALSTFFQYFLEKGTVATNPTEGVVLPRIQLQPHPLSSHELADLLYVIGEDAKTGNPPALRGSAMIWLMYATWPKASELTGLNLGDINLEGRVVLYHGSKGSTRTVPIVKDEAVQAVQSYLADGRPNFKNALRSQALFLSQSNRRSGSRPTRQWLWMVLKDYANQAGIGSSLISNALRDTYAAEASSGLKHYLYLNSAFSPNRTKPF